eukprot:284815246_2
MWRLLMVDRSAHFGGLIILSLQLVIYLRMIHAIAHEVDRVWYGGPALQVDPHGVRGKSFDCTSDLWAMQRGREEQRLNLPTIASFLEPKRPQMKCTLGLRNYFIPVIVFHIVSLIQHEKFQFDILPTLDKMHESTDSPNGNVDLVQMSNGVLPESLHLVAEALFVPAHYLQQIVQFSNQALEDIVHIVPYRRMSVVLDLVWALAPRTTAVFDLDRRRVLAQHDEPSHSHVPFRRTCLPYHPCRPRDARGRSLAHSLSRDRQFLKIAFNLKRTLM